ncbi:MAG: pyridoxamine 5'-phosphate oxidase family protein, partial [Chloroflexi bacterium]|nr:pyridoxamine 5'-phosphate oxidase family protein [Chloroflexota bacterium]
MTESTDREEFFKQANIAILATIGPGQRSHAMPIWYLYEDGHFLISASRGSQKVRNVERQGEATLVVDRRDLPYYAVMVRGRAELGDALDDESRLRL